MAFKKIGSLNPHGGPILRQHILTASLPYDEGNFVKSTSGFAAVATEGANILGSIVSLVTFDGVGEADNGAGGAFSGTYTTPANNTTTGGKHSALIDISKMSLYSADLLDNGGSAASPGDNTGSDLAGYGCDIYSEDFLDESTTNPLATPGTTYNVALHGTDPADSSNNICNIVESEIFAV